MSFGNPLALLFLLGVPLLLILYTVRRRRLEATVSSLLLWVLPAGEPQGRTLFRRLRLPLILLIQILLVTALALALARSGFLTRTAGFGRAVLIVDTSASMQATDERPSRFARALGEARAVLDRLAPGEEAILIAAGPRPTVAVPLTREVGELRTGLARLRTQDGGADLAAALRLAAAFAEGAGPTEVHLFTDGASGQALPALPRSVDLRVHPVGGPAPNVAITGLRVRKNYYSGAQHELFVALANTGQKTVTFPLVVTLEGARLSRQQVTLPPQTRRSLIVPLSHRGGGALEVTAEVADALAVDNRAWALLPPPRTLRVLLVTRGNLFLEQALRSDPQVELALSPPPLFDGDPGEYDVVVLDGAAPALLKRGRYVLLNAVAGNTPLEVTGTIRNPVIVDWDRSHPAMRFLDLSQVVIEEALRVRPLAGGRALIESTLTPLALAFEEGGLRMVFVGFDPVRSDLPLRAAFPLFLSNAIRWLYPTRLEDLPLQTATGHTLTVAVPPGVTGVRVTAPDGTVREVPVVRGGVALPEAAVAGIYLLEAGEWQQRVAANLVDEDESNLTPRLTVPPGGADVEGVRAFEVYRELWPLLTVLALALLLLEALLFSRSARPVPGSALAARGAVATLCLAALLLPQVEGRGDRLNVLFLLDESDSVPYSERLAARQFVREALAAMRGEDRAGVAAFAGTARLELPLDKGVRPLLRPGGEPGRQTNLAEGIAFALAAFPRDGAHRVVLLSDGNETRGDAVAEALRAREREVELYVRPVGGWRDTEVLLERMVLPREVKRGEPFAVRVVAWASAAASGHLSLYRDGKFVGSQKVELEPGKNAFAYRQTLSGTGFHVYQAALEVGNDTLEENNRAAGVVAVRGQPKVMVVDRDPEQARHLLGALRAQEMEPVLVDPARFPRDLPPLLAYDGVILSNVSSLRFSRQQMELVRTYVRDQGGGLLMLGGEESFGVGGYFHTPVEEALPVTMEARQKLDVPSLAVVLVIDRSGSMETSVDRFTKLDLAKEAAQLVVELLDERNEVGVVAFDTANTWVVPVGRAERKDQIINEIGSIKSGGGTDMFPALKEAYEILYARDALLKHLIVLSDGQSAAADFGGLIRRMTKDKITVSTVAIGRDADVRLMRDISRWGRGRFYFTEDPQSIPRIFTLEAQLASKSAIIERPFRPVLTHGYHEILRSVDWREVPPLGGYVATTPKLTAEVLLASPQGDPVLAAWRFGVGRAAAFTSDLKAKWGVLWLRWPPFGRVVAQMVRWTLRTKDRADVVTHVAFRDGKGIVSLEAANPQGEFINFIEAEAGIIGPDGSRTVIPLTQVAPGQYEGSFAAEEQGAYLIGVAQRRQGTMIGSEIGSLVLPYSPEHRSTGVNQALLARLASLTGGGFLEKPEEAFRVNRRLSRQPRDAWPFFLGTALLLFLGEVAARRLRQVRAGGGPAGGGAAGGEVAGMAVTIVRGRKWR
ncbi:MAG: VWA domain-containing protein [candidate division NC10 bacterium]